MTPEVPEPTCRAVFELSAAEAQVLRRRPNGIRVEAVLDRSLLGANVFEATWPQLAAAGYKAVAFMMDGSGSCVGLFARKGLDCSGGGDLPHGLEFE